MSRGLWYNVNGPIPTKGVGGRIKLNERECFGRETDLGDCVLSWKSVIWRRDQLGLARQIIALPCPEPVLAVGDLASEVQREDSGIMGFQWMRGISLRMWDDSVVAIFGSQDGKEKPEKLLRGHYELRVTSLVFASATMNDGKRKWGGDRWSPSKKMKAERQGYKVISV